MKPLNIYFKIKKFIKILSIIVIFITTSFPNSSISKYVDLINSGNLGNGIWIHINSFNNSTDNEIYDLCEFLLKRDIRNVFILSKDINGELLYKKYENTLKRIIKIFKKYEIRIHYYIPIAYDPKFLKENPKEVSFLSPDKNNLYPYPDKDMRVVNLSSDRYLNYIKTIVQELIYQYDAQGIQLDYIRYPNIYYGYDENLKNVFISKGGDWERLLNLFRKNVDIFVLFDNKDKDILLLSQIRSEVITKFASEIRGFVKSISKDILFSVTLIQSGSSFLSYKDGGKDSFPYGFLHFGQDYSKLSEISDFVSPLAYHKNYDKDLEWVREIIKNTKKKVSSKILCGIQANDIHENLDKLIKICKEENVNFSLFRLGTFLPVLINIKSVDILKYEINFIIIDRFYEYSKNFNFEIKIKEIPLTKMINIKENFIFSTDKSQITIYLKGIPLLLDKENIKLFNTIKFKIGEKTYFVDGNKKIMDATPFLFNGRTMVPIRVIAETLGYEVSWNNGEIILKNKNLTVNLYVNENIIILNGYKYYIDSKVLLKDGRTYLPIRYISEILNLLVSWDPKNKEVIIEGYINDEEEKIILYKSNLNNIFRNLIFNKSKYILFDKDIDISSLINFDSEFILRGVKLYLIYDEKFIQYKDKLTSFDGFFVNDNDNLYFLKKVKIYNIFDSTKYLPKDALLNFVEFRFKEKSNYYIYILNKFYIDIFKPYVEKDQYFSGFILKENNWARKVLKTK